MAPILGAITQVHSLQVLLYKQKNIEHHKNVKQVNHAEKLQQAFLKFNYGLKNWQKKTGKSYFSKNCTLGV